MARWWAVSPALAALLFFVALAARLPPAVDSQPQHSRPTVPTANTSHTAHRHLVARITQNGQGTDTASGQGRGAGVPIVVFASVSAVLVVVLAMSIFFWFYYRHATLSMRRQYLERLGPWARYPPRQEPPHGPPAPPKTRTAVAADANRPALPMSSSAQLSPTVFSALQEGQPTPPPAPIESKMKRVVLEDKVLGRREDIMSLGRRFDQAAGEDQYSSAFRVV